MSKGLMANAYWLRVAISCMDGSSTEYTVVYGKRIRRGEWMGEMRRGVGVKGE